MKRLRRSFLEKKSKVETFIGFSIKAGKVRCGVNAIATLKKVNLLILCATASDNTKEDAKKLMKRFHCHLIISNKKTVEELTGKEKCKLMAITDKGLSKAIEDNLDNDFTNSTWEAEK